MTRQYKGYFIHTRHFGCKGYSPVTYYLISTSPNKFNKTAVIEEKRRLRDAKEYIDNLL